MAKLLFLSAVYLIQSTFTVCELYHRMHNHFFYNGCFSLGQGYYATSSWYSSGIQANWIWTHWLGILNLQHLQSNPCTRFMKLHFSISIPQLVSKWRFTYWFSENEYVLSHYSKFPKFWCFAYYFFEAQGAFLEISSTCYIVTGFTGIVNSLDRTH